MEKNESLRAALKRKIKNDIDTLINDYNMSSHRIADELEILRRYIRKVKRGLYRIVTTIYADLKHFTDIQNNYDGIIAFLDGIENEFTSKLKSYTGGFVPTSFDVYTKSYIYSLYNKINTLLGDFSVKTILCIDLDEEKEKDENPQNDLLLDFLPGIFLDNMKFNQKCYPLIYCTENFIRLYISHVYFKEYNDYSLDKFFDNCSKAKTTYDRNKRDEEKYAWLKERGFYSAFYLDFSDLKNIIISNWDSFKKDFPDQSFVNYNFDEFYKIRCKVAHNSYTIENTEYEILLRDSYKITNQLKKYYEEIKQLSIS